MDSFQSRLIYLVLPFSLTSSNRPVPICMLMHCSSTTICYKRCVMAIIKALQDFYEQRLQLSRLIQCVNSWTRNDGEKSKISVID